MVYNYWIPASHILITRAIHGKYLDSPDYTSHGPLHDPVQALLGPWQMPPNNLHTHSATLFNELCEAIVYHLHVCF